MGVEGSAEEPALTARRGGSGPWSISVQPHAPATKPSGFPHFQMHTNRSKYRVLPGNAPALQGRGWQEKFALSESQSVFHKAFVFYKHPRGRSSGNPLAGPRETQSRESRAEERPRKPGSSRARVAAAPGQQEPSGPSRRSTNHAAPLATRLLQEGGSR